MSEPGAGAPVILTTTRLVLAPMGVADLPARVALLSPEPMRAHLAPGVGETRAQFERLLRDAGSWALYGYGMFGVRLIGEPRLIGTCGVFRSYRGFGHGMDDIAEAGWIVAHDHWGDGIAGEAMRAVLAWFDAAHAGTPLKCMIAQANTGSRRLATRLGFAEYDRVVDAGAELVLYRRG